MCDLAQTATSCLAIIGLLIRERSHMVGTVIPQEESVLGKLGPGLITGAADDDPSGIAVYSQAGASFGFNLLWTVLLTYPLMVGIQFVSARIGRVSGHGLATNIRRHYPRGLLFAIVGLLFGANAINIGADISAMAETAHIVAGGPAHLYALGFGMLSTLLQVFIPYKRYVRLLKWLTLALLAYVGTVFVVQIPWAEVLRRIVMPELSWKREYISLVVALFGTTISPYLFFWQASQEVEDIRAASDQDSLLRAPAQAPANLRRLKIDTIIGMGFSNAVAFFIMLTTAVTLHLHGAVEIASAADAARALQPVAGQFAFLLFGAGIIGTGLLAIPVLAGSSAYAIAGALHWDNSLEYPFAKARGFYGVIAVSTALGLLIGESGIDPIKALFWSAVINGVIAVPVMVVMMLMVSRADIMGRFVASPRLKLLGWLATLAMAAAVVAMFVTL
jgi:NRAMP (natural resistance-associated macrophage protein)-like metal ion transporter